MMAATSAALLATLAGCKSSSSDDNDAPEVVTPDSITLNYLGRYSANIFGASAAEIPAFDPVNQRIFIVNAQKGAVDVLNAA
ncbi:MAG TPA: alkaline phosphatase, partial [Pseudomonas sp.]|nr:alkaline phosphatase [Pseudomonas sp.]